MEYDCTPVYCRLCGLVMPLWAFYFHSEHDKTFMWAEKPIAPESYNDKLKSMIVTPQQLFGGEDENN